MSEINVGDVMRLKTEPPFTDENGDPADPGVVQCIVRRSGQPPVTYTSPQVVHTGVGTYHLDYPITKAGRHYYRWQGSGGVTAAEENYFDAITKF